MIRKIIARLRQLHKRKAFILISLSLVSIAIALLITSLASYRLDMMARTRQVTFTIDRDEIPVPVIGTGVSISELPKTNLLKKSSFEPHVFRRALHVIGGTDNTIIVENEDAMPGVFGEGFFVGAIARINTYTANEQAQKKTGIVTGYSPNVAREFIKMPIEGDIKDDTFYGAFAQIGGRVIIAGSRGIVINNASTQSPDVEFAGVSEDIAAAASNKSEFFITTKSGEVFSSEDASSWINWKSKSTINANSIAASENAVIVAGDKGIILVGQSGFLYKRKLATDGNITGIIFDGKNFIAITDLGEILISSNGLYWEIYNEVQAKSYLEICYADSLYALITSDDEITIYNDMTKDYLSRHIFEEAILSVAVLSKSKVFALGESGKLYETADYGINWNESTSSVPEGIKYIFTVGDNKLISTSGFTNTFISELVTEIKLDSPLAQGSPGFQSGDVCYLSVEYPVLPESLLDISYISEENPWIKHGTGNVQIVIDQGAPASGVGILEMTGDFENTGEKHFIAISQKIGVGNNSNILIPGNFYNVSMWLKQESIQNNTVKVWISGLFDPIGIEFNNIGTSWRKYTFKFSFPPNLTNTQAQSARINIGTEFEDTIYIDEITLTEVFENESIIKQEFKELISEINPVIIRNEYLKIGSLDLMPNRWSQNGSLDNYLNLLWENSNNSSPWIVIDSAISEAELRNLLEYVFGSVSTTYGRIRLQNGYPVPWITRFDRLYFEFVDSKGIFTNDAVKSAYINHLIDTIQVVPFFNEIRNKIVFVDGLNYSDGILLSRADYSSSDLEINISSNPSYSIDESINEYRSLIPRTPDRSANLPYNILRAVNFQNKSRNISTASYATVLLEMLGNECVASLTDISSESYSRKNKSKYEAVRIISETVNGNKIGLISESQTTEQNYVRGYAFAEGNKIKMVFTSLGTNPSSVFLNIPETIRGAVITRIDSTGQNIETTVMRSLDKRFTILPGQVIVLILD